MAKPPKTSNGKLKAPTANRGGAPFDFRGKNAKSAGRAPSAAKPQQARPAPVQSRTAPVQTTTAPVQTDRSVPGRASAAGPLTACAAGTCGCMHRISRAWKAERARSPALLPVADNRGLLLGTALYSPLRRSRCGLVSHEAIDEAQWLKILSDRLRKAIAAAQPLLGDGDQCMPAVLQRG